MPTTDTTTIKLMADYRAALVEAMREWLTANVRTSVMRDPDRYWRRASAEHIRSSMDAHYPGGAETFCRIRRVHRPGWRTFAVVCRWTDRTGKVDVSGSAAVVLEAPSADHAYRAAYELRPDLPLGSDASRKHFYTEVTISEAQTVSSEDVAACHGAALVLGVEPTSGVQ